MQQPVLFYSPQRSINSSQHVPLDGAFWTATQGQQLLPGQPAPCPFHTHCVPFQCKEPPKTLAAGGSCGAEGRVVLHVGASSSKLSFPLFLPPPNKSLSLWVSLRPVQGLGSTWAGERDCYLGLFPTGGENSEESGQSTALPTPLITFLHALRSRTSQQPSNSFSSPSP